MNQEQSPKRLALERTTSLITPSSAPDRQEQSGTNHEVHETILSEFKVKYDQLKAQYEEKKKEADNLLFQNKKLQIEMLHQNVGYYEKEISRLRQDVEKFQTENEHHKHRLYIAQNNKNELEATSKVKQEELKQVLKQLEKEKITVVELRHQLTQKDSAFTRIVQELQAAAQETAQRHDQVNNKLLKAESDMKIKAIEAEQLRRQLERRENELAKEKKEREQQRQKFQLNEYRLNNRLADLEEDIRDYKSKENTTVKDLQAQVAELENRCANQDLVLIEKNETVNNVKMLRDKEIVIATLEQNVRELEGMLAYKNNEIAAVKARLEGLCPISELRQSQDRYQQMLNRYRATEKYLENKMADLEKELALAKAPRADASLESKKPNDFQELLKSQIGENSKLKLQLASKTQQLFSLKNRIEEQQIKEGLLENEIEILRRKQQVNEKNSKIEFEIDLQNLRNEVETLRRKLEVTETKFGIKIKEVKDKDTFITNVLIGRSKPEDVPFVLAELKRIFEAEYSNKLAEAELRLNDLQLRIKGEINDPPLH